MGTLVLLSYVFFKYILLCHKTTLTLWIKQCVVEDFTNKNILDGGRAAFHFRLANYHRQDIPIPVSSLGLTCRHLEPNRHIKSDGLVAITPNVYN